MVEFSAGNAPRKETGGEILPHDARPYRGGSRTTGMFCPADEMTGAERRRDRCYNPFFSLERT